MEIDLIFPTLPPAVDGIGDYTVRLGKALSENGHHTRIRTSRASDSVDGLTVVPTYDFQQSSDLDTLYDDLIRDDADWVVVQYNPFSYGPRGFNLALPRMLRRLSQEAEGPRLAVMVHEPFVPRMNWKFALMSIWQRWQFRSVCRSADMVFFSIQPWAERFESWFPDTPIHHLPVSSNMPRLSEDRARNRSRLSLSTNDFVLGIFGSAHPSRLLPFVKKAVDGVSSALDDRQVRVLYIGTAGKDVADALGDTNCLIDLGRLDADDVSRAFSCMDLYLAPFRKGVSTRRGSFMTGLQHGIATVSTRGVHTDHCLLDVDGTAIRLAPDHDAEAYASLAVDLALDDDIRHRTAIAGQTLFDQYFDWPRIAGRMVHLLDRSHSNVSDRRLPLGASDRHS